MSGKKEYKPEGNPVYTVIYIVAVILLLCALVFMAFTVRNRQKKQEEAVQEIASDETEYVIERQSETESETAAAGSGEITAAGKGDSREASAETESEDMSETESETEVDKGISILLLNGTRKEGVAANWKDVLEEDGYTDVYTASYSVEAEEHTVLYTETESLKAVFEEYFPGCELRSGEIEEGIELEEDTELPDQIDLYIVVGKSDSTAE